MSATSTTAVPINCWYCQKTIDLPGTFMWLEVQPTSGAARRREAFHEECAAKCVDECAPVPEAFL